MWIKKTMYLTVLYVIFGLYTGKVYCFPNGPPRSACADGLPIHTKDGQLVQPQESPSPYIITVNASTFQPGDTINIKVHSSQGEMFKGLFVQVRPLANADDSAFRSAPLGEYYRRIMNTKPIVCVNSQDTLVHKDPFMKIETKFDWKAPLLIQNDVIVTATVLKDFSTFWTKVESPPIKLVRDKILPAEKLEKPWLKEIIKTIKVSDVADLKRELVRERFERGFKGAFDPNGYIMVQYINDMLPFEDRFESQLGKLAVIQNTTGERNSSEPGPRSDQDIGAADEAQSVSGEPTVEIPLGVKIKKANSSELSEYDRLVSSLLKGNYDNIERLSELLG